jgi:hypothetical protein
MCAVQRFGAAMLPTSEYLRFRIKDSPNESSFWGFYLGRPFRMNAGDISVPKPASALGPEKEESWHPYGHQASQGLLQHGLKNPTELICRQFVVLWEMISPVGHILYVIFIHHFHSLCDADMLF